MYSNNYTEDGFITMDIWDIFLSFYLYILILRKRDSEKIL